MPHPIEPLEPRIAPATVSAFSFRDVDGDLVKVIASKGTLDPAAFTLTPTGMGKQFDLLNLTDGAIAGANLTIKVTQKVVNGVPVGDGIVNVGKIDSTGFNLVNVKISGDITEFHAGDGTGTGAEILQVRSVGKQAALFPTLIPGVDIAGRLGQLLVAKDVISSTIKVGTADGHGVGIVQVGRNFTDSTLAVGTKISQLTVTGSLTDSKVFAPGLPLPATVSVARAIVTLTIGGSMVRSDILAGYDSTGAAVNGDAGLGTIVIAGNFAASNIVAGIADGTMDGFGRNDTTIAASNNSILATIASLKIKGTARGSATAGDFFGITANFFGVAKIHGAGLLLTNDPTSFFDLDPVNHDLRLTVV